MRGCSFSKLNSPNHEKILKTAHKGLFCSLQSNPAPAIVYGQRNNCFEVTAVVVLYFTASEKENENENENEKKKMKPLTIIT